MIPYRERELLERPQDPVMDRKVELTHLDSVTRSLFNEYEALKDDYELAVAQKNGARADKLREISEFHARSSGITLGKYFDHEFKGFYHARNEIDNRELLDQLTLRLSTSIEMVEDCQWKKDNDPYRLYKQGFVLAHGADYKMKAGIRITSVLKQNEVDLWLDYHRKVGPLISDIEDIS